MLSRAGLGLLVVRVLLGGLVVSAFAAIGETLKPKTFSGLFGAAPSVALASLGLAFANEGSRYVVSEARCMMIGAAGLLAYAVACVWTTRGTLPVWLGAGAAWLVWGVVAVGAFCLMRFAGALQ